MPVRLRRVFLGGLICFGVPGAAAAGKVDHGLLDHVLRSVVDPSGGVDYAGLKSDPDTLLAYILQLSTTNPNSQPEVFPKTEDRLAYWLNAYNALVMQGAIEADPISSVKEIAPDLGFFKQARFTLGGRPVSLDLVEHEIIRERFKDPRIHAAINCAARSCPPLARAAFWPEQLEDQLEGAMRGFIRDLAHVRIDGAEGEGFVSKIFGRFEGDFTEWYRRKFNVPTATIIDYLSLYLDEPNKAALKTDGVLKVRLNEYDWSLNGPSN